MRQYQLKAGKLYYFYNLMRPDEKPTFGMLITDHKTLCKGVLLGKSRVLVGNDIREADLFWYRMELAE